MACASVQPLSLPGLPRPESLSCRRPGLSDRLLSALRCLSTHLPRPPGKAVLTCPAFHASSCWLCKGRLMSPAGPLSRARAPRRHARALAKAPKAPRASTWAPPLTLPVPSFQLCLTARSLQPHNQRLARRQAHPLPWTMMLWRPTERRARGPLRSQPGCGEARAGGFRGWVPQILRQDSRTACVEGDPRHTGGGWGRAGANVAPGASRRLILQL